MLASLACVALAALGSPAWAAPAGLRHSKPHVHELSHDAPSHSFAAKNASHAHKKKSHKKKKPHKVKVAKPMKPWSYADVKAWEEDFPACGKPGQSPIPLESECVGGAHYSNPGACTGGDTLRKHVRYTAVAGCYLKNTGKLMEVDSPTGFFGTFHVGKYEWHAKQLQFHMPSEHTLNGKRFDAELQIVHVHPTAAPLVLSIFVEEGEFNHEWLSSLGFDMLNMPHSAGGKMILQDQVDLSEGLEEVLDGQYLSYEGSLTTPPCTEGVKWFVATKQLEASKQQMSNLKRRFSHDSSRPLQPLQGRQIYQDENIYSGAQGLACLGLLSSLLAVVASF